MLVMLPEYGASWGDSALLVSWTAETSNEQAEITGQTKPHAGVLIDAKADCLLIAMSPFYNKAREILSDPSSNDPEVASITLSSFAVGNETNALGSYVKTTPLNLDWKDNALGLEFAFNGGQPQEMVINATGGLDNENGFAFYVGNADMSSAQSLSLAVPLSDGTEPVVDINPSDPALRNFIANCRSTDPSAAD